MCVNVLLGGGYLAGGITRLLRDRRPVGAISKGGHCYYRCVCARPSVRVCELGAVDYANVVTVKERGGCFGVTDSHCCCLLCWSMKTSGRSCSSEL